MKQVLSLLMAVACIMAFQCGQAPTAEKPGGTSTEVIVSLDGNLVNEDGTPAVGTMVYLRPADYLPNVSAKLAAHVTLRTIDTTRTDSLGNFAFDSIAAGTYTLECLDGEPGNGALIDSVIIGEPDSTVELAPDTLKPLGTIAGQIQFPESLDASQVRVMVYGLDRVVTPDSTGDYVISGLAEGTYTLRVLVPGGQAVDADGVVVVPDTITWATKSVLPGADKIYAPKATGAITMDGRLDEADWAAAGEIGFSDLTGSENRVSVRTLWDSLFLYVAFTVKDSLVSAPPADSFRGDAVEIFLDPEHDATENIDQDDRQLIVDITGQKHLYMDTAEIKPDSISTSAVNTTIDGYSIEIRVPWTFTGTSPVAGLTMGALFTNWDRDTNFVQFDWLGIRYQGNGEFKRPVLWGDLILTP